MTELLSQAYSKGNGILKQSLMKVLTRDTEDALTIYQQKRLAELI
jgi:hypothetical protein